MNPREEKFWGVLGCFLAFTFYCLAPLAFYVDAANPQLALANAGLVSSASFGLLACSLGLLVYGRRALGERLALTRGLMRGALAPAALVALCVGMLALGYAIDVALELTGLRRESSLQQFDQIISGARGGALVALLVGIGIAPGLGEELLFRGFLQNRMQVKLGRVTALVLSSLLFGLMHLDLAHSLGAFVFGLYLGLVLLLDQSLRGPILCHVFNNTSVVLIVALTPTEQKPDASVTRLLLALSLALATLIGVWMTAKHHAPAADPSNTPAA